MAPKRKIETLSEPDLNTEQQQHPAKVRRTSSESKNETHLLASRSPSLESAAPVQAQGPDIQDAPALSSAPLTRKNLRLLETMAKSKASSNAGTSAASTANTAKTEKSRLSTTDTGFEDELRKNNVPDVGETQLSSLPDQDEIEAELRASRASGSPTLSFYQAFNKTISKADNEATTVNILNRFVLKDTSADLGMIKEEYDAKWDKQWTDYPKDIGFNNGLSAPKPDYIEGYSRSVFPPNIKKIGGSATLVKANSHFIALPHFALEAKASGKSMHLAEVQAQYDGAAMVYGRNKALEYMEQADPPQKPAVASMIADGRNWDAFLHYEHKDEKTNKTTYRTHEIATGSFRSYAGYKDSRKTIRNLQDMMHRNAADLKDRLQKDYDEHGLRPTGKSSAASSATGLSATQSGGSGGSVQSDPAGKPATITPDTPSARSRASSGSQVAQPKADTLPRKAPSSASASSGQADIASADRKNVRRTDKYRNRDDSPASLQRRRSDSPDRSRPPEDCDGRRPRSRDERAQTDKAEQQSSSGDERGRNQYNRSSVKEGKKPARDDAARPKDTAKPIARDNGTSPKNPKKSSVTDDGIALKNPKKSSVTDDGIALKNTSKPLAREDKRSASGQMAPIQKDRKTERDDARDDTRRAREQKAIREEYTTPERSSASGSSTSSNSRVLNKPVRNQYEDLKRSKKGDSNRVKAPTTDPAYGRRWP